MGSGIDKRALDLSVYDVLLENATVAETRQASPKGGFDVVGANRELAGAEIELVGLDRRDKRLRAALGARGRRLRLRARRLPAQPQPADAQRPGQRPRRHRADAMRILRPRGPVGPGQHDQAGARQPEPRARGHRHPARDVRRAHHAAGAGERAAEDALRRQGVRHRRAAQRPPRRSSELRHARPRLRSDRPKARSPSSTSRARWWRGPTPGTPRRCNEHPRCERRSPSTHALLARIEDAGINASAPREQRWVDGWLVRLSPRQGQARALHPGGRAGSARHRREARAVPAALRRCWTARVRAHHAVFRAGRSRCPPGRARHGAHRRHPGDGRRVARRISSPLAADTVVPVQRSRAPMPPRSPNGSAWRAARRRPSDTRTPTGSPARRCRATTCSRATATVRSSPAARS